MRSKNEIDEWFEEFKKLAEEQKDEGYIVISQVDSSGNPIGRNE